LSLILSVTPITRLQLLTSTLQPSNAINLLSANFKFITSSSRSVQFALCSRLKKTLSNIPLSIYSPVNRAADLHSGGRGFKSSWWTVFFFKDQYFLHTCFLKSSFDSTVTWHIKNGIWAKSNTSHLRTRICWLLNDSCFGRSLQQHVEGTGVGNSCHFLWCIPVKTT